MYVRRMNALSAYQDLSVLNMVFPEREQRTVNHCWSSTLRFRVASAHRWGHSNKKDWTALVTEKPSAEFVVRGVMVSPDLMHLICCPRSMGAICMGKPSTILYGGGLCIGGCQIAKRKLHWRRNDLAGSAEATKRPVSICDCTAWSYSLVLGCSEIDMQKRRRR